MVVSFNREDQGENRKSRFSVQSEARFFSAMNRMTLRLCCRK